VKKEGFSFGKNEKKHPFERNKNCGDGMAVRRQTYNAGVQTEGSLKGDYVRQLKVDGGLKGGEGIKEEGLSDQKNNLRRHGGCNLLKVDDKRGKVC